MNILIFLLVYLKICEYLYPVTDYHLFLSCSFYLWNDIQMKKCFIQITICKSWKARYFLCINTNKPYPCPQWYFKDIYEWNNQLENETLNWKISKNLTSCNHNLVITQLVQVLKCSQKKDVPMLLLPVLLLLTYLLLFIYLVFILFKYIFNYW